MSGSYSASNGQGSPKQKVAQWVSSSPVAIASGLRHWTSEWAWEKHWEPCICWMHVMSSWHWALMWRGGKQFCPFPLLKTKSKIKQLKNLLLPCSLVDYWWWAPTVFSICFEFVSQVRSLKMYWFCRWKLYISELWCFQSFWLYLFAISRREIVWRLGFIW